MIQDEPSFRIDSQNEDGVVVEWTHGTETTTFVLSQGVIDATTPAEAAYMKMEELAGKLKAEVIGEDEKFIVPRTPVGPGVFAGRVTWIGWPILVIALTILLIWRW